MSYHLQGIARPAGCDGEGARLGPGDARGGAHAGAQEEWCELARHCGWEWGESMAVVGGRGEGGLRFSRELSPVEMSTTGPLQRTWGAACKMACVDWPGGWTSAVDHRHQCNNQPPLVAAWVSFTLDALTGSCLAFIVH